MRVSLSLSLGMAHTLPVRQLKRHAKELNIAIEAGMEKAELAEQVAKKAKTSASGVLLTDPSSLFFIAKMEQRSHVTS